ncbi:quaternary amine ABC transporter ATP-binding protein [Thermodesulforhabdus norvegica]|uniref:Glycine betaine/proline transport system ATP-binding protein n=1 Tax=Thermodesulforhabdus norvegica TaxID=39841 RepID=A0A1I4SU62_9BACT|nr:glycine betaine/L-proline ABC transporter ATP-binding protein [Thermodesulforhabdus norvegica]SFM67919.1 glycine betaine/proline transport system ATP-binding protein [Thermodesulforhabdus norvegica]
MERIRCSGVWKIFGQNGNRVIDNWDQYRDLSKTELLKKTGCVVGVRDVSFSVTSGEIFVIMGLSGSGKSTLLRCINRLHEPTRGRVYIDGEDITDVSQKTLLDIRRRKIAMVFQHFALLPHRRVIDNVAYGLEIQGVDKRTRYARAAEVLELVGLKGWERQYPHELSGGMQQRMGLARALAPDPEILLMDEAFSALDPLIRRQMQEEFVKLLKVVQKTIVFVTHDLHEALRIATRIAIMRAGAFEQIGTPAEIVLKPKTKYISDFVRDLPKAQFVTARDIMDPPSKWAVRDDQTGEQVINKMNAEGIWHAYVVDSHRRICGVVDYRSVIQGNGNSVLDYLSRDFPVQDQNTFLEKLIDVAARTSVPIAVIDENKRLVGVVSRERLLETLAS